MKKYRIIYADPPWEFETRNKASSNSKMMGSNTNAKPYSSIPVKQLLLMRPPVADDAVLLLWTVSMYFQHALEIGKAWGFTYKTVAFVWVKTKNGKLICNPGYYTMQGAEFCLLFTRGKTTQFLGQRNIRQVVVEDRRGHSQKPDGVRTSIAKLFTCTPRLEMFAREKTRGWDVFGNQVKGGISLPTAKRVRKN